MEEHLSDICLFVDDAVIGRSGLKNKIKLQPCGNSIYTWCRQNQMVLGNEKTNTLFISSKRKHNSQTTCIPTSSVIIDQNELEEVENAKFLGVFIDSTLSWKKQVAHLKQCVSFKLWLLRRIRKYPPFETWILFYNYYIKPIIEYCCRVWGTGCRENTKFITKLQMKASRLILDADPLSPSKEMFKKLNWLPFKELVKYKQACPIYRSKTDQTYIQDLLTNYRVSYSLRSSAQNKFYLPRAYCKSLSYLGVDIWNSIPNDIRHAESLSRFKVGYHNLLLEHEQNS